MHNELEKTLNKLIDKWKKEVKLTRLEELAFNEGCIATLCAIKEAFKEVINEYRNKIRR